MLNVNENDIPEKYSEIIRRLIKANSEPEVRRKMDLEDDLIDEIRNKDLAIKRRDEKLELQEVKMAEKDKAITEKDKVITEKDKILIKQQKSIEETAKFLKSLNVSIEIIIEKTGLTRSEIKNI